MLLTALILPPSFSRPVRRMIAAAHREQTVFAERLLINYIRSTHKFAALRTMQTLEIEIETSPSSNGKVDLDNEWDKAFLADAEKYPLDMQPYWEPFIACIISPKTEECEYYEKKADPDVYNINPSSNWKPNYPGVYTVGKDVMQPKIRSRVEPRYTDVARFARVQGTVLLEAIEIGRASCRERV